MDFVTGLAIAIVAAWLGARLQAARTRRQWQAEMGADAWRGFVRAVHAWRGVVAEIERLPSDDPSRPRLARKLRQRVWDMGPEAPSLHIFGPPIVNDAAFSLVRLADAITDRIEGGSGEDTTDIETFDRMKWDLVVLAAGEFGVNRRARKSVVRRAPPPGV